ncbi:MAG: PAS domain S-box protein [Chloroflexi bacterium]|nr:PAS domain S-box protein [Chloroflexota bacterium]
MPKVLIVDDDLTFVRFLEHKLSSEGYEVVSVNNGVTVIQIAQTERPDVILMDVMMPVMDGFETCQRLKSHPTLNSIPVIMVTARDDEEDIIRGLDLGATDYVAKPIVIPVLLARLRSAVRTTLDEVALSSVAVISKEPEIIPYESEEKYRLFIDNLTNPLVVYDTDGIIMQMNSAAANNIGTTVDNAIGKPVCELIPVFDEGNSERIRQIVESGKGLEYESEVLFPIGQRWVRLNLQPIKDSNGNVIAIQSISYDITDRKNWESTLRTSDERFRRFAETSVDIFFQIDKKGNIQYISPKVYSLFGRKSEDLIGRHFSETMPNDDIDSASDAFNKILNGNEVSNLCIGQMDKKGLIIPVEINATPVIDEISGEIIGLQGVMRDITERKQAEYELLEHKERLNSVLQNSPDFVTEIDHNCIIQYMNRNVPGFRVEDTIGKSLFEFIQPEDHEGLHSAIKHVFETGEMSTTETVATPPDGLTRSFEARFGPVKHDGRVESAIMTATDISERKVVEEQQCKLNKYLIERNREQDQIIHASSHDLRSPVLNIQGFTTELDLALKQLTSVLDNEDVPLEIRNEVSGILMSDVSESLIQILSNSSKMDQLITGLSHVSRAGRHVPVIEDLNMNHLMATIKKDIKPHLKMNGIILDIDDLPFCKGDKEQIKVVFTNLIGNAVKYLDAERKGVVKVTGWNGGDEVTYCVEDNGIGIRSEYHEKIFEIFHQLNPTNDTGDGLGLTITNKILGRHGGNIWIESELGSGSKFFVSLASAT